VTTLHTRKNYGGHLGIYAIGSQWWCKQGTVPGGSCNVTCDSLVDDDIADDVACANLIMSQQGVAAFGTSSSHCREAYEHKTDECLAEYEVLADLLVANVTTSAPSGTTAATTTSTTTTTTPKPTTTRTTTTTTTRTTERTTYRPFPRFTTTTTRRSTSTYTTHRPRAEEIEQEEEGSNILIWIFVTILLIATAVLVVKFVPLKPKKLTYHRNQGFDNLLGDVAEV
jgi:nitric oxide reductase large subunit